MEISRILQRNIKYHRVNTTRNYNISSKNTQESENYKQRILLSSIILTNWNMKG